MLIEGSVALDRLAPEDSRGLIEAVNRFSLDFDDTYQYAAKKYNLAVVSFDPDFDRTEYGRRTLGQIGTAQQTENKE